MLIDIATLGKGYPVEEELQIYPRAVRISRLAAVCFDDQTATSCASPIYAPMGRRDDSPRL
jgi:hypothetical protein